MNNILKVFHPILFAVFPVIFLYSHNTGEVLLFQTLIPFVVCFAAGGLLWILFGFICRNKMKSALLTSILLIGFFFYGHVFSLVKDVTVGNWKVGIHTYFLPVWTAAFSVPLFFVFRTKKKLSNLTRIMNLIAFCLVAISFVNIGLKQAQVVLSIQGNDSSQISFDPESIKANKVIARPDIYYIILDAHVRADILEKYFGHDSSDFISGLKAKGFFVGEKSRSNYIQTLMSIPSSLNFKYLDEVQNAGLPTPEEKKRYMRNMVLNNRLFKFLKGQGYKLVSFSTDCELTAFENADVFLSGVYTSDAFTNELINCTPFIALEKLSKSRHYVHYRKLKYTLNFLPETARIESPHIVFAHIMCPHPPFVFDADGNFRSSGDTFRWEDENPDISQRCAKYLDQLKYIDKKISEVVDGILANSKESPVIIIQGDHGIRWKLEQKAPERTYSILNALHLPGYDYSKLDNEITPVNTFRFILNHYFGTEFEILDNKTYASGPPDHTNFKEIKFDN